MERCRRDIDTSQSILNLLFKLIQNFYSVISIDIKKIVEIRNILQSDLITKNEVKMRESKFSSYKMMRKLSFHSNDCALQFDSIIFLLKCLFLYIALQKTYSNTIGVKYFGEWKKLHVPHVFYNYMERKQIPSSILWQRKKNYPLFKC